MNLVRTTIRIAVLLALLCAGAQARQPNFVVILTDDQGYGDLGCYGATDIRTPEIDRMAAEGMRFTRFLAAAPICTPTRAALMTGAYAVRTGLGTPLHTPDRLGLHPDEITLAELLRDAGYATGCVGKWHLGHHEPFLPTRQGFDYYYGTPMGHMFYETVPEAKRTDHYLRNEERIPHPPAEELTERFTEEAVAFIERNHDRPFFLYLPHTMPHIPLAVSERFRGKSAGGLYGDVIEAIDWSTGQVLEAIRRAGIADNTYVIFTSDNGPHKGDGSPGPFRGGKHSAYEGGMRVSAIFWGPGRVPAGAESDALAVTFDIYPTLAALAGAPLPTDRAIDGKDLSPLIHGEAGAASPHDHFLYYVRDSKIAGIERGGWKLLVDVETGPWSHQGEALYNLADDPGEQNNLLADHPEKVRALRELLKSEDEALRAGARAVGVAP